MLPVLLVGGIPAIAFVFGLVEFSKKMGATGRTLTLLSMLLGIVVAVAIQLASAIPVDPTGWLTTIAVGFAYGMTASGIYDFTDKRTGDNAPAQGARHV